MKNKKKERTIMVHSFTHYLRLPKCPPLGLLPPTFLLPPKELPLDLPKVPLGLIVPMLPLPMFGIVTVVFVELLGNMLLCPFPNRLLPLLGLTL